MVNMGELFAHPRLRNAEMDRVPLSDSEAQKFLLNEGDLLFARQSLVLEGAGKCSIFLSDDEPVTFESHVTRVRLDRSKADPLFYFYYLQSHHGKNAIRSIVEQGAGASGIRGSDLQNLGVVWMPPPEQHAIAHILGILDDKIELNRRLNQTLEAMARALFKDWFVDFGPVRAKMEGREPYLPADLWQLFPDRLDDEGKPEGWRRSTIGSEVTVCGGSTPSTKEPAFWEGGEHHWATPKDLSTLKFPVLLDTIRKITDAGIEKISSGLLPVGTVLLSSRAPIGYLAITEVPTAINQGFIAMKCDGTLPNVFVLLWSRENMEVILGNANGSTFQEISKSNFRPIPVIVPPESILKAFRERTEPLYRHIVENERESRTLAQLRDTLLPKLISGELRIADAEKFLERMA
jgi:type I restriction enzyme S subunit